MLQLIKNTKKKEINKKIYKYILMQIARQSLSFFSIRRYIIFIYNWDKRKISLRNNTNICFLTGRSRAIYRTFHLSRLKIREHAQQGHFVGLKKISW